MNRTLCDLLSPDPLPKCLTCSHQSPTLASDPEDTETVRGGEDRARATENERDNAVSTEAGPFPVAPLNKPGRLFLHKEYSRTMFVPARCYQWQQIPDSPPLHAVIQTLANPPTLSAFFAHAGIPQENCPFGTESKGGSQTAVTQSCLIFHRSQPWGRYNIIAC